MLHNLIDRLTGRATLRAQAVALQSTLVTVLQQRDDARYELGRARQVLRSVLDAQQTRIEQPWQDTEPMTMPGQAGE